ncbi:class I SAM-dependent methyltransferase [candidate division CSSED10-310 bacterium]|uniref:Class I SAM-dependent methyltransferase n=1 Tax=candidate division CSSED10-310 bacterium TaxID=2855610 RepID=A0ABV6YWT4_UNCC1
MINHTNLYTLAKYYDIAFDFRDIPLQCNFLEDVFRLFCPIELKACLELAAGPAYHSIEFAARGVHSTALDMSPPMVDYGLQKACDRGVKLNYVCQDMINFNLDDHFELAFIMLDSAAYLINNKAVFQHLESVARCLTPGGIYVLELSHPKDAFHVARTTAPEWTMRRDDVEVHIRWGHDEDPFDPITQLTKVSTRLEVIDGERKELIVDQAWLRSFTFNEFRLLVQASPYFDLKAVYGDLDQKVSITADRAWRMVAVLQSQ